MFPLRTGSPPVLSRRAAVSALALTAAALGGCNQHTQHTHQPYWTYDPPQRVAAAPPREPAVVMEDDGKEGQIPPPLRRREVPDDPREPWSRNYGTVPPARAEAPPPQQPQPAPRDKPAIPDDLPPAFRRQLVSAIGE